MANRFRGFLPVVVDVETGGFNCKTDALLEVAAVLLEMDEEGLLSRSETIRYHVKPFEGANLEPASLAVNGIDPNHPLRPAIDERDALQRIFREVRRSVRENRCSRAVLVGHNAHFDLGFMNEAVERSAIKRYRNGLRHRVWSDCTGPRGDCSGTGMGRNAGAFRILRCGSHRGCIL
jgi:ribonuclease T